MSLFIDRKTLFAVIALSACATPVSATTAFYDHNGSRVGYRVNGDAAYIEYVNPRAGLEKVNIGPGTVLFEGRIGANGWLQGKAYTFAAGCAPAAYAVSGQVAEGEILLRGAAPRRSRGGCAITQYVARGAHSALAFTALGGPAVADRATVPQPAAAMPAATVVADVTTNVTPSAAAASVKPPANTSEYDGLFNAYLAEREPLTSNVDFARAVAQFTGCASYAKLSSNEFDRERFNAAATDLLAARVAALGNLHLRLAVRLGAYDLSKQAFSFKPLVQASVYEVSPPREYGCGARHAALPDVFAVRFENHDLIDGVPMASRDAEQFVKSRIGPTGLRDDNIIMDVELEPVGRFADPVTVETGLMRDRKKISSVATRIVGYSMYSDARARLPFAQLSAERKELYAKVKARREAEEAADAKVNQPFSFALVAKQFTAAKAAETIAAAKRTRLSNTGGLTRDPGHADGRHFKIGQLGASYFNEERDRAGNRVGPALQFTNPNPFETVELPQDVAARIDANLSAATVNRLYVPAGVIDDAAANRAAVMGQIVGIEIEIPDGDSRFRYALAVPGDVKPFVFQRDERPAAEFEIKGLKVGLSPSDIGSLVKQQAADVEYDAANQVLRSGGSDCASWAPTGQKGPPCLTAEFDVVGRSWFGSDKLGMTRMSVVQNMDFDQTDGFIAGFVKQFGPPRVRISSGNVTVLSWGALLARTRDGGSSISAGLHVAEIEVRRLAFGAATRFLLTDAAYLTKRNGIAPAQKLSQR